MTKGRPKTEQGQKILVGLKLYPDEKTRVTKIANEQGYSVSQYCRLAILERLKQDEE